MHNNEQLPTVHCIMGGSKYVGVPNMLGTPPHTGAPNILGHAAWKGRTKYVGWLSEA